MTLALVFLAGLFLGAVIPPMVLIALAARRFSEWGDDGWRNG